MSHWRRNEGFFCAEDMIKFPKTKCPSGISKRTNVVGACFFKKKIFLEDSNVIIVELLWWIDHQGQTEWFVDSVVTDTSTNSATEAFVGNSLW